MNIPERNLLNKTPKDTYTNLVQIYTGSSPAQLTDGNGDVISASLALTSSWAVFVVNGSTGSANNLVTGSLVPITSSRALTASSAPNYVLRAGDSMAGNLVVASNVFFECDSGGAIQFGAGPVGNQTAVLKNGGIYVQQADVGNLSIQTNSGSVFFSGSNLGSIVSASLFIGKITGSQFGTSSWAVNVVNSPIVTGSTVPITASNGISSSYAITSSFATTVLSESFDNNAWLAMKRADVDAYGHLNRYGYTHSLSKIANSQSLTVMYVGDGLVSNGLFNQVTTNLANLVAPINSYFSAFPQWTTPQFLNPSQSIFTDVHPRFDTPNGSGSNVFNGATVAGEPWPSTYWSIAGTGSYIVFGPFFPPADARFWPVDHVRIYYIANSTGSNNFKVEQSLDTGATWQTVSSSLSATSTLSTGRIIEWQLGSVSQVYTKISIVGSGSVVFIGSEGTNTTINPGLRLPYLMAQNAGDFLDKVNQLSSSVYVPFLTAFAPDLILTSVVGGISAGPSFEAFVTRSLPILSGSTDLVYAHTYYTDATQILGQPVLRNICKRNKIPFFDGATMFYDSDELFKRGLVGGDRVHPTDSSAPWYGQSLWEWMNLSGWTNPITSSFASSTLITGSTVPITASWALRAITSSTTPTVFTSVNTYNVGVTAGLVFSSSFVIPSTGMYRYSLSMFNTTASSPAGDVTNIIDYTNEFAATESKSPKLDLTLLTGVDVIKSLSAVSGTIFMMSQSFNAVSSAITLIAKNTLEKLI